MPIENAQVIDSKNYQNGSNAENNTVWYTLGTRRDSLQAKKIDENGLLAHTITVESLKAGDEPARRRGAERSGYDQTI